MKTLCSLFLVLLSGLQDPPSQGKLPLDEITVDRVTIVKLYLPGAEGSPQGFALMILGTLKLTTETLSDVSQPTAIQRRMGFYGRLDNQPLGWFGDAMGGQASGGVATPRDKSPFAACFFVDGPAPTRDADLTTSLGFRKELAVTTTTIKPKEFQDAADGTTGVRVKAGLEDREDPATGAKRSYYCVTLRMAYPLVEALETEIGKLVISGVSPECVERNSRNELVACFDPGRQPKGDAWEIHCKEPARKLKLKITDK